jgi:hypothetical protein
MSANGGVDWRIAGEEVGSCNCDWACPCQFEGDPTHGNCHVVASLQITEGHFGDVDLGGVNLGVLFSFPGPLYEGNGTHQLFVDEQTSEEQRDALEKLWSGKYGGPFFEIFSAIAPNKLDTVVTSVEIESDRERRVGTIRIGDVATSTIEPIKSPATGDEHRVRIDLPNGFEYKQAEVGNTVQASASSDDPLSYSFEKSYAQLNRFDWSPAGAA